MRVWKTINRIPCPYDVMMDKQQGTSALAKDKFSHLSAWLFLVQKSERLSLVHYPLLSP
jgi:hypothetical protein